MTIQEEIISLVGKFDNPWYERIERCFLAKRDIILKRNG
jgi:hypothetical protein